MSKDRAKQLLLEPWRTSVFSNFGVERLHAGLQFLDHCGIGLRKVILFAHVLGQVEEVELRLARVVTTRFFDEQLPAPAADALDVTA